MPTFIVNRLQPQALRSMHVAPEHHHGAFAPKSVHSNPVSKSPLTIASATAAIRSGIDNFLRLFNRLHSTKPVVEPVVLVSYRALSERADEKMHQLIGKSVHPATAEATMHAVRYDGVGRITGFAETATDADIELIEQNLIVPLHQTPTAGVANRSRTPAEAIIALAVLVERTMPDSPEKNNVARSLKENFLSGKTTLDSRATLFTQLLVNPALRALSPEIRAIMGSINHVPHATVVNDNYYGRLFDSALARYVVEHPTPDMLGVTKMLSTDIKHHYQSKDQHAPVDLTNIGLGKVPVTSMLKSSMVGDPEPWSDAMPEVRAFMATPDKHHFLSMLDANHRYAPLLSLALAAKYMRISPQYKSLLDSTQLRYHTVIAPQKHRAEPQKDVNAADSREGLMLPYQADRRNVTLGVGVRPIDRIKAGVGERSDHDRQAIAAGRAMGVGMSGTANLLRTLFNDLQERHGQFPMEDAKLISAAYLTFSGGHSINEAYTTFEYDAARNFEPISYQTLSTRSAIWRDAVDHAYDRVLAAAAGLAIADGRVRPLGHD